jgi:pimeloyl-ACP methyl ester carboxylesterase
MLHVAPAETQPALSESLYFSAPDGLRLHVRAYGAAPNPRLPVVCLPGLARTETDFETLAQRLACDPQGPRRVFALDYRGRGRSEYDRNWQNYDPRVELEDLLAITTALGIERAIFVGTSRGGILTMLLAAARPTLIGGAVLNDIGPVIEPKGLMRIKGYVGKIPRPTSYADGVVVLRRLFSAQFPNLTDAQWLAWSKRSWEQREKGLVACYDPKLANTLKPISSDTLPPPLWAQFDAMTAMPIMVIRGMLSDILSRETLDAMRARRGELDVLEVTDQGHAPLLDDEASLQKIADFVARCDAA